jgi:heptosyltransferase III
LTHPLPRAQKASDPAMAPPSLPVHPAPPTLLKRLELLAKQLLALVGALLLWRPGRPRSAAQLPTGRPLRILLVRPDNRVGEALLTTPLLETLRGLAPAPQVDVLVHQKVARVLEGHPAAHRVLAFDRRRLWLGALAPGLRRLRREAYDVVVDCANWTAPSVTSALVSRLAAPRALLLGPALWPVRLLHSVPVPALEGTRSEAAQRLHLLSPLPGLRPVLRLSFRTPRVREPVAAFQAQLRGTPYAVVNPGGRLGWRRVDPEVFAAGARALAQAGVVPVVTWGPGEEAVAGAVVAGAPGARLAPPTDLDELAALMAGARLTLCNNTGPMHLSVAVGTPTLALFLHMELERWGHAFAPHRMLDLTPLAPAERGPAVAEAAQSLASARPSAAAAGSR